MSEDHLEPMYGDSTMPAMNKLGEFELSPVPKWRLRMAGIAMVGTSIGMQKAYMGISGYSVQHVLYAIAGIMVFLKVIPRGISVEITCEICYK